MFYFDSFEPDQFVNFNKNILKDSEKVLNYAGKVDFLEKSAIMAKTI